MNNKNEIGLINISRTLALVSFLIGSLILIAFYVSENDFFVLFGFFYLILALIINSVFLLGLIVRWLSKKSNRKQTLVSIGIMLANIPVTIIYYHLAMSLIGRIAD